MRSRAAWRAGFSSPIRSKASTLRTRHSARRLGADADRAGGGVGEGELTEGEAGGKGGEATARARDLQLQGDLPLQEEKGRVGGIADGEDPIALLEAERHQGLLEGVQLGRIEAARQPMLGEGDAGRGRGAVAGEQALLAPLGRPIEIREEREASAVQAIE